ncbi:uncharacterized protein B0J16DRAFT_341612 [Fusarium flagelliforme]|uniref:uncharacterized protein n=1 Tax=Fusarium flagelliforme TaxID=2675880 RepID=UPI001E8DA20A|nr:uncharacterized protein B0J16DRAFT_341612 [Fusarium flagelliforme]KAH7185433.1 hypothetical protein B0J16DRAFT_341612 [Fusarium flagelliforme]
MKRLFRAMRGSALGLPPDLTITMLPASMPGTTMQWLKGVTMGEQPSQNLFALCLIDDIRTIGLPSYHYRNSDTQLLGVPDYIAAHTNPKGPRLYVPDHSIPEFWNPWAKVSLVSISGDAESVGPVFKPVIGKQAGLMLPTGGLLGESDPDWVRHILPHPVGDSMGTRTQEAITQRNKRRLDLAKAQGVKMSELTWCHD